MNLTIQLMALISLWCVPLGDQHVCREKIIQCIRNTPLNDHYKNNKEVLKIHEDLVLVICFN